MYKLVVEIGSYWSNMDKAWAWLQRNSFEYESGAKNFVYGASSSMGNPAEILCPCVRCRNVCHQLLDTVVDHLVMRGMDLKYRRHPCWFNHGDRRERTSADVPTSEEEAYDLLRTAYFESEDGDEHPSEAYTTEEAEFREKLEDAETALYSTCQKYNKVSAITVLYNIKVKSGMSENFFDQLLTTIKDMLPEDNVLPKSTAEMKKFLKVFGFGYDAIHACKNDCILYRKQYAQMESCPRCTASRWEMDKHSGEEKKGIPAKVDIYQEQIKTIDSQMESTANDNIREDAVSQVLGRDKPGRIRGLGRGITATKLAVILARDTHVQKLESEQAELRNEVQDLRKMVNVLAGKNEKTDNVGAHSGVSHVSGGVRCQLLDWIADKDIIVGEGEFCSSDPLYKIGRIPLGPNAAAVIVKSVLHPDSQLWRPAQNIVTLGEAVGLKIPWQGDKVLFDESTSPNITSGSKETISPDESLERCELFDWNSGDAECIAEGVLCSTDPKEMINNIPIGINACIVKIDLVLRDKAYLWRPTSDLHVMADAMDRQIQWPLTKMKRITQNAEVPSVRSSPENVSSNAGSSKGKNKKCLLLDCKNSDLTVAEGRVFSTDPAETVHNRPLGPNATKVWVLLSLKDNAEVWRPSSDVQFIGDAEGTTVAWPNHKIVYL